MIRRDIHWDQLQWTNLRDFVYEWDALIATTKKTQGGEPPVWKRGQQMKVVSFLYSVADYLNTVYGQYNCPLGYLIDEDAVRDETLPDDAPPLIKGGYYSDKHHSLATELQARAPRFTAVSQADNASLFTILVKCFQLSPFAAQAQPFEKTQDGMGFWRHLKTTNATSSHHEAVAKDAIDFCRTAKWGGPSGGKGGELIDYAAKLRRQFSIYQEAQKHVSLQSYDDRTRVGWFLDNVTSTDVNVVTYLTTIRHTAVYRDNWEAAMSYMSECPYKGKTNDTRKRGNEDNEKAEVAGVDGEGTPSKRRRRGNKGKNSGGGGGGGGGGGLQGKDYQNKLKQSGGRGEKTGVDLRWHTEKEYKHLSVEERAELNQWRNKSPKKGKPNASGADAELAALKKQQSEMAAAIKSLTSAISSAVPGANVSAIQAVAAAADEASSQPAGESEHAEAGFVNANDGNDDDNGGDDRKPSAIRFADVESDVQEQTRIAAAVGLASILKSNEKKS